MKKIVLGLCVLGFFVSCDSSDISSDDRPNTDDTVAVNEKIAPPAWLYGTWVESDDEDNMMFDIVSDDFRVHNGDEFVSLTLWNEMLQTDQINFNLVIQQKEEKNTYTIRVFSSGHTEEEAINVYYFKLENGEVIYYPYGFDISEVTIPLKKIN